LELRSRFRRFFAIPTPILSRDLSAFGSFSTARPIDLAFDRPEQQSIAPSALQLFGRSLLIAERRTFLAPEIDFITLSTSASVLE
jgi:hypothetical protein